MDHTKQMIKEKIRTANFLIVERWLSAAFLFFENHFFLTIIIFFLVSLGLRMALTPYHLVLRKDAYVYLIYALDMAKGNFSPKLLTSSGWPLFMAPFFFLFKKLTLFENMVLARVLSNFVSALSIIPIALISRKLLSKKGLVIVLLIATFTSPLLLLSGSALSEPLFTFLLLLTLLFVIKSRENRRNILFAAAFASLAYMVRFNGVFLLPVILISVFFLRKDIPNYKHLYLVYAAMVFCLVAAPMLIQRYVHFGSMFFYGEASKYFVDSYQYFWSYNIPIPTLMEYLLTHTFLDYINKWIIKGFLSIFAYYLWFTIPSALLFFFFYGCLKKFRDKNFIPFWVLFAVWVVGFTVIWEVQHSDRFLSPTLPFILIISAAGMVILLQEYRFRHTLITIFLLAFALLSLLPSATEWYHSRSEEQTQLEWGEWIAKHLHGTIATFHGDTISYFFEDTQIGKTDPVYLYSEKSKLRFIHPGYFKNLTTAMQWYSQMNVSYFILDKATLDRRPYFKEISLETTYLKRIDVGEAGSHWDIDIYYFDQQEFGKIFITEKVKQREVMVPPLTAYQKISQIS